MPSNLPQLKQRIHELDSVADEVEKLVRGQLAGDAVQPDLNIKGQRWFRGAREILVQQKSSSLSEFEGHYTRSIKSVISTSSWHDPTERLMVVEDFLDEFRAARALVIAVAEEVQSRELPVKTQLSFAVSADEFERAAEIVDASGGDEPLLRAAGVIGRVALERHLWTVAESRGITVPKNPPTKKKADTQDVLTALVKASVVSPIQKSEMDGLFTIGNNCAHPKEIVKQADVERLLTRGGELAAVIL